MQHNYGSSICICSYKEVGCLIWICIWTVMDLMVVASDAATSNNRGRCGLIRVLWAGSWDPGECQVLWKPEPPSTSPLNNVGICNILASFRHDVICLAWKLLATLKWELQFEAWFSWRTYSELSFAILACCRRLCWLQSKEEWWSWEQQTPLKRISALYIMFVMLSRGVSCWN